MSKLQIGASVGTRACTLAICIRLYKITRFRGSAETAKQVSVNVQLCYSVADIFLLAQRRKFMIYQLLLIVGLPSPHHGTLFVIFMSFLLIY